MCYPKRVCHTLQKCKAEATSGQPAGKPNRNCPPKKIDVTRKLPVGSVSVVTLIRTDTTLDHSQKAEKVCIAKCVGRSIRRVQNRMSDDAFMKSHSLHHSLPPLRRGSGRSRVSAAPPLSPGSSAPPVSTAPYLMVPQTSASVPPPLSRNPRSRLSAPADRL